MRGVSVSRTRVALADDDVLLREGLSSLLERSGFEVVAQAGDAAQLIAAVRDKQPDLVIVDIRMPPDHSTEGLDAARVIRGEFPQTAVLVLSAHAEVEHAMDLLASGERSGYLLKDRVTDVDEFIETLRRLVRGASVVDPALVHELVAASRVDDPLAALSTREREVLALMAEGRSNAGIARCLWVTEGTVEKHVRSILMKLRLPDTGDDHRRVLAVLAFLDARLPAAPGPPPASWPGQPASVCAASRSTPSTRSADSSHLGRNAIAGLAASRSARSSSACVEIMITWTGTARPSATSWRARSNPLSVPSSTSTRATSGWAWRACCTASAVDEATATTAKPPASRILRAISRKPGLSSTSRQRTAMRPGWHGPGGPASRLAAICPGS
jgi:DNA-binding NarL/FixJ family response regulator